MPEESQPEKVVTKIRTYAADLELQKEKQGMDSKHKKQKKPINEEPVVENLVAEGAEEDEVTMVEDLEENKLHFHKSKDDAPALAAVYAADAPQKRTKIPAFHELQTDNEPEVEPQITKPKPAPKKKGKKAHHKPNFGYDATVITDTKRKRFKLFPSLMTSIKEWFQDVLSPKKRVPKYTVSEATNRKGIIQEATTKTGSIFTADSDTIKDRIKKRQKFETRKEEDHETSWSPFTETGYKLLDGDAPEVTPKIQNVEVEYKKSPFLESIKKAEVEKPPQPPKIEIKEPEKKVPIPAPQEPPQPPKIEIKEPEIVPEKVQKHSEPKKHQHRDFSSLENWDTNTLTIIVLSIIIGLVILVMVSKTLITNMQAVQSESGEVGVPPSTVINGTNLKTVTLDIENTNQLPQLLSQISNDSSFLDEVVLVTDAGSEIDPSFVFDLLDFETNAAFQQSLTAVHFVTTDSDVVILLKFVDETTVRGGLLYWEPSMLSDMQSVYYLPTATNQTFVDEEVSGLDARVLYVDGGAALVYTIVNENTAVIARNLNDFSQVVSVAQSN